MGQSVCSSTTQHECCLLQSATEGQSEPNIHEEFDAYLHQLGSSDAYLCPSGRFMSQMTMTPRDRDGAFTLTHGVMHLFPTGVKKVKCGMAWFLRKPCFLFPMYQRLKR